MVIYRAGLHSKKEMKERRNIQMVEHINMPSLEIIKMYKYFLC